MVFSQSSPWCLWCLPILISAFFSTSSCLNPRDFPNLLRFHYLLLYGFPSWFLLFLPHHKSRHSTMLNCWHPLPLYLFNVSFSLSFSYPGKWYYHFLRNWLFQTQFCTFPDSLAHSFLMSLQDECLAQAVSCNYRRDFDLSRKEAHWALFLHSEGQFLWHNLLFNPVTLTLQVIWEAFFSMLFAAHF